MGSSFAQRLSYPKRLKILKARGSESAQSPCHMEFYFIYCHINRHNEDQSIQSECGFLSIDQRIQLMKGIMKINSSQNSYFQYELTFAQWLLF